MEQDNKDQSLRDAVRDAMQDALRDQNQMMQQMLHTMQAMMARMEVQNRAQPVRVEERDGIDGGRERGFENLEAPPIRREQQRHDVGLPRYVDQPPYFENQNRWEAGLLAQFQGPPHVENAAQRVSSSIMNRQNNECSGLKDRQEVEDSSECSQGSSSALVSCSQSDYELANAVPLHEDMKLGEDAKRKHIQDSQLSMCSEEYYTSMEEIARIVPEIQCGSMISVTAPCQNLHEVEVSESLAGQMISQDMTDSLLVATQKSPELRTTTDYHTHCVENHESKSGLLPGTVRMKMPASIANSGLRSGNQDRFLMADETLNEGTSSSQSTGERSESTIKINVKTLESQIYTFLVNKDMSVPMLKEKVANAIGIPVEQQRLIFRGRVLKDDHLLSEYHLEDGHTLHLVARQPVPAQPATGAASENTGRSSGNQGNDSTGNAPRNRAGQVAQSVVLGTVNIADQGEGMITDISRLIGAVLHSLGAGILAPPVGGTGNTSPAAVAPGPETEGTQNASGRTQPGNPRPGLTVLNHPIQIPQISPAGTLPWQMVIPDSLTTLSDFISHMELVLQNSGSLSSATTNARAPPRSNDPSLNLRGLPTSEMLGSVVEQAQRLLSINASNALSQFAANLERGSASTDPSVWSQIQMEAMHVGVAMQHLGSMLLELGRTMMMLRMGQFPAESFVNAGPAVYISSTGPNPIMVQPFLQQTSPFLGVSSPPLVSGVSGTFGIGDPSRNINILIHAGTPGAPGGSSVGTRASSEGQSVVQASQSGNGSGDSASVHGLPARTVIAAIPAHSSAETASHVLSVIYPVQVRSQASVSIPSASSQGSQLSTSGGAQPNAAILVPQPSPDSASVPAVVAQTNARVATVSGQGSSSPSLQSTDTRGSQPTVSSGAQPSLADPFSQSSLETDTIARLVSQINTQIANALSSSVQGHNSSSFSVQHANTTSPTQGPRPDQSGENSSLSSSFSEEGESDEDIKSNQALNVPVSATQSQQATPGSLRRTKRLQNKHA